MQYSSETNKLYYTIDTYSSEKLLLLKNNLKDKYQPNHIPACIWYSWPSAAIFNTNTITSELKSSCQNHDGGGLKFPYSQTTWLNTIHKGNQQHTDLQDRNMFKLYSVMYALGISFSSVYKCLMCGIFTWLSQYLFRSTTIH
jgi:hypothetical protein